MLWSPYQIPNISGCACAGNAGNVFPAPRVSDPGLHYGTCVTNLPWCMPGSLTSCFLWSRWRRKRSRHSRRMRNPQFCVSGKRPMSYSRLIPQLTTPDLKCWQVQCEQSPRQLCTVRVMSPGHLIFTWHRESSNFITEKAIDFFNDNL